MSERRDGRTILTLQTIGQIDNGKVALAVNQALRMCTLDVEDRPGDSGKRKVQLTIELTPRLARDNAALEYVVPRFRVKATVPERTSREYPMRYDGQGRLYFVPESPNDPDQRAFPFPEPATEPSALADDDEPDDDDGGDREPSEVSPM